MQVYLCTFRGSGLLPGEFNVQSFPVNRKSDLKKVSTLIGRTDQRSIVCLYTLDMVVGYGADCFMTPKGRSHTINCDKSYRKKLTKSRDKGNIFF